jgi:hypothetical protein
MTEQSTERSENIDLTATLKKLEAVSEDTTQQGKGGGDGGDGDGGSEGGGGQLDLQDRINYAETIPHLVTVLQGNYDIEDLRQILRDFKRLYSLREYDDDATFSAATTGAGNRAAMKGSEQLRVVISTVLEIFTNKLDKMPDNIMKLLRKIAPVLFGGIVSVVSEHSEISEDMIKGAANQAKKAALHASHGAGGGVGGGTGGGVNVDLKSAELLVGVGIDTPEGGLLSAGGAMVGVDVQLVFDMLAGIRVIIHSKYRSDRDKDISNRDKLDAMVKAIVKLAPDMPLEKHKQAIDMLTGLMALVREDMGGFAQLARMLGGFELKAAEQMLKLLKRHRSIQNTVDVSAGVPATMRNNNRVAIKADGEISKEMTPSELFRKFDENGNGSIDYHEFCEIAKYMNLHLSSDRSREIFARVRFDYYVLY